MTAQDSKSAQTTQFLDRIGNAVSEVDVHTLRVIVTDALKAKAHHSLSRLPEFRNHMASIASLLLVKQDEERLVLVLAELGRLHRSLRSERDWILIQAAKLLNKRMPESFQYGDGDQRYHAAIAVLASGVPVKHDLLAKAVVEEDKGEKARRIWVRGLLASAPLSNVFRSISVAIGVGGLTSGEGRSLRLQRVLGTLRDELAGFPSGMDEDICAGFSEFVGGAFSGVSRPREYKPAAEAVEELINVSIQLIRLKFRLGAEPALYQAVALAERWLPRGGWKRLTATSAGLMQLRRTLLEGLILLLEQGKPDRELLEVHGTLSPNRELAREERLKSEKSTRSLSPELRRWLVSGGVNTPVAKAVELDEIDDLSIAMAMILADNLSHRTNADMETMLDDIRFRAPVHYDTITSVVGLTRELIERVNSLAERRHLRLFGSPGELVDYSPHAYRLPEGESIARRVQVKSPGVEKQGWSASRVIVPALVNAADQ